MGSHRLQHALNLLDGEHTVVVEQRRRAQVLYACTRDRIH